MSDPLDVLRRKQQIHSEQRDLERELRLAKFRDRQGRMARVYEFVKALEDAGVRSKLAPKAEKLIFPLGSSRWSPDLGRYELLDGDLDRATRDDELVFAGFQILLIDDPYTKRRLDVSVNNLGLFEVSHRAGGGYRNEVKVVEERGCATDTAAIEAIADLIADYLIETRSES